jgi:predicted negative regulator of RcsB-dependent stress response
MATLQTDEANIIDAEEINWRLIVYPALVVLLIVIGGLGYYYYLQSTRETAETDARAALVKATTPDEFLKVAEQYPQTDQAMLALLSAGDASFKAHDYDAALTAYHRVADNGKLNAEWRDAANLGVASCLEAQNKVDDAITFYLQVATRGEQSSFAPYAYHVVAQIYDQRGDKTTEHSILQQAVTLDPASVFTRTAQDKLKEMDAASQQPMSFNVNPTQAAPAAGGFAAPPPNSAPPAPAAKQP